MDRTELLLARFEAEYLEPRSVSRARRIDQRRTLLQLTDAIGRPLDEMTTAELSTFIGCKLREGLHVNTVTKYLSYVRTFVSWAAQAEIIEATRAAQLRSISNPRGAGTAAPRPYSAREIVAFRELLAAKYPALPEYGKGSRMLMYFVRGRAPRLSRHLWRHARRLQFEAQIALALEQGLRRIEIHRLTIPAMHYDNDQVVVLTAKQGPGSAVTRAIPYTTHARNVVQQWLDFRYLLAPPHTHPWLSLNYVHGLQAQLAPMGMSQLHGALLAFGPGWEWHRFRHTAATEWLRSGVPLEKVRIFMGHSSLEQTLAYAKIVNSDIEHAFGEAEADFARRMGLAA